MQNREREPSIKRKIRDENEGTSNIDYFGTILFRL